MHPHDRTQLAASLEAATPEQGSTVEVRITGSDGVHSFDISVHDLPADPSVRGLVLTAHDVTEHLALESEMAHRALPDAARVATKLRGAIEKPFLIGGRVSSITVTTSGSRSSPRASRPRTR